MDQVFKALNDPSRRLLLDRLFERDGQTLGELCDHLPQMTRFGVMNHLRLLEEAALVVARKAGRSKYHYLNPVPIRLVHDRWIGKYTEPWVGALAQLKAQLEETAQRGDSMSAPDHVYQAFVRCTPEAAWQVITDGDQTVQYYYGTRVESEWNAGSPVRYMYPDGSVAADGEVLAFDPPQKLEMTFHPRWDPELEAEGPVRTVWLIDEVEGLTRVTVEYFDLASGSRQHTDFTGGIPYIISGLKTLLETGKPLA